MARCREHRVAFDEAYFEYVHNPPEHFSSRASDGTSLFSDLLENPGLASLRVGYGIAHRS